MLQTLSCYQTQRMVLEGWQLAPIKILEISEIVSPANSSYQTSTTIEINKYLFGQ